MENLKIMLFERTAAALEIYKQSKVDPEADRELERRSFCALFQLIEDAGLEDEYYEWKYGKD